MSVHRLFVESRYLNRDGTVQLIKRGFDSRHDAEAWAHAVAQDNPDCIDAVVVGWDRTQVRGPAFAKAMEFPEPESVDDVEEGVP